MSLAGLHSSGSYEEHYRGFSANFERKIYFCYRKRFLSARISSYLCHVITCCKRRISDHKHWLMIYSSIHGWCKGMVMETLSSDNAQRRRQRPRERTIINTNQWLHNTAHVMQYNHSVINFYSHLRTTTLAILNTYLYSVRYTILFLKTKTRHFKKLEYLTLYSAHKHAKTYISIIKSNYQNFDSSLDV